MSPALGTIRLAQLFLEKAAEVGDVLDLVIERAAYPMTCSGALDQIDR
jgi:hypothetical protein